MLRKALPEDFDFIYGLYMDPDVNPWLLYEPMTKEAFASIYDELLERQVKYVFSVDGNDAGMVKIIPSLFRNAHIAYIGGLAIDPAFKGRGYGLQLLKDVIRLTGENGFSRLELSVAVSNHKAIHLYEKAGFRQEGLLKKYTYLAQSGQYMDEALMALLL